jgi:hypothetical protein
LAVKYVTSFEEDGIHDHILQKKCQKKTIIFRINKSKNSRKSLHFCRNEADNKFCKVCKCDFAISHVGVAEITLYGILRAIII